MPSKNLSGSRRMLSAKLLSGLPEGLGVLTFFVVFFPLYSAELNYLVNFGLSFAFCYVAIFVAKLFVTKKFVTSQWTLGDKSEARDLTLKTRQFEER